jgi:hypothetical protein
MMILLKKNKSIKILYNLYFHPSQIRFLDNLFKITLKKDVSLFFNFTLKIWDEIEYRIINKFKNLPKLNTLLKNIILMVS